MVHQAAVDIANLYNFHHCHDGAAVEIFTADIDDDWKKGTR